MNASRGFLVLCFSVTAIGFGLLSACSSATGGGTKNDYCGQKYLNPLTLTDDGTTINSTVALKAGTPFTTAVGDYSYQNGFIYYNDIARNIRFLVAEAHDGSGNLTPATAVCIGGTGLTKTMATTTYTIPFVSDIQSDGTTVKIRTRILNVEIGPPTDITQKFFRPTVTADKATFVAADPTNTYSDPASTFSDITQTFSNVTIRSSPFNFALASYLNQQAKDSSGNVMKDGLGNPIVLQNVRVLVYMQTITPEQRDKIDHPPVPEKKPKP